MTMFHAVVWIDHHRARVLQFDAEHVQAQHLQAHHHATTHHRSAVRTEHEFFGSVCDALAGIPEVLVVGPRTGLDDFHHYVDKHRPALARHVVAYEVVDHPTEPQLVALARRFFVKADRMAGVPTPS